MSLLKISIMMHAASINLKLLLSDVLLHTDEKLCKKTGMGIAHRIYKSSLYLCLAIKLLSFLLLWAKLR